MTQELQGSAHLVVCTTGQNGWVGGERSEKDRRSLPESFWRHRMKGAPLAATVGKRYFQLLTGTVATAAL